MDGRERLISCLGLALLAALLALAFRAYLSPAMLFEFANLMLCT